MKLWKFESKRSLRARIKDLEDAVEHNSMVDKQVKLLSAGEEPDGAFVLKMSSKVWPLIAECLAAWFDDNGGKNYVEQVVDFDNKKRASMNLRARHGSFILTMQRVHGKTPAQLASEAREIVQVLLSWCKEAEDLLSMTGYSTVGLRAAIAKATAFSDNEALVAKDK